MKPAQVPAAREVVITRIYAHSAAERRHGSPNQVAS